ncbi:MAG: divergent polysaccharide deacetylase family protein [Synergistales bacterium]|nr:divergent polysaccharide deacetylase family protein [Synergistales bacterium]
MVSSGSLWHHIRERLPFFLVLLLAGVAYLVFTLHSFSGIPVETSTAQTAGEVETALSEDILGGWASTGAAPGSGDATLLEKQYLRIESELGSAREGNARENGGTGLRCSGGTPLVAIVVDDFGYNLPLARRFAGLEISLTWAIIPGTSGTEATRRLAEEKQLPYMIHLPMQAISDTDKDAGTYKRSWIVEGMASADIRSAVRKAFVELPEAVALNNHRGSLATSTWALMEPLMCELGARHLPFVDSRTSGSSIAYEVACRQGLDAAYNSVFLDHYTERSFMQRQLDKAVSMAERRGWVVVICHNRPATYDFLASVDTDRYDSVEFVTIPQLFSRCSQQ